MNRFLYSYNLRNRSAKRLFPIVLILICCAYSIVNAKPVAIDTVQKVTQTKITYEESKSQNVYASGVLRANYAGHSIKQTREITDLITKKVLAYVMDLNPKGYIVVSPDTDITPVIAYSFESDFVMEDSKENVLLHLVTWDMRNRLKVIPATFQKVKDENNLLWDKYLSGENALSTGQFTSVQYGPLISTTWGQSSPYNNYCPIDPTTDARSVTGCVATSMAQIVNYYAYPSAVTFSASDDYYTSTEYIYISATSANFSNMTYPASSDGAAKLSYACGVASKMDYGSDESGANHYNSAAAFKNKFGYLSADVKLASDSNFYTTLQNNMVNGEPAQLGIWDGYYGGARHSVVCDGYKSDTGQYHLNLGWNGSYDAWYSLPDIGTPYYFNTVENAVVNIAKTIQLPMISAMNPGTNASGGLAIINGNNFGTSQGVGYVKFYSNQTATIVSWSDTQIQCLVPSGAATGNVTVTTSGGTSAGILFTVGYPQSPHNYPDNTDFTSSYTLGGSPSAINVIFDAQTNVEAGYDAIYVMDGNGNNITGSPFTGTALAGQIKRIPGATVRVRLTSDSSVNYWGFNVTGITPAVGATALTPMFIGHTDTSLTVSWTAVAGANYVAVLASESGYSNIVSSVTQSGNTKAFSGLSAGTAYYFEVKLATETDVAFLMNRISTTTNHTPVITSLTANPASVSTGAITTITCAASDSDGDTLTYNWSAASGTISGSGAQVTWTAPISSSTYRISCTVSDGKGGAAQQSVNVNVTTQQGNMFGGIIFSDDFSGAALDSSKWQSGGNSVNQADGILTLSADVTDHTGWVRTEKLGVSKIAIHIRHWMQPGGDYFMPSIILNDDNGDGIIRLIFKKSLYGPDYCNDSNKYNKVLLYTKSNSCVLVGNANSDTYYGRWTETYISYDATSGNVVVDLDADGVIDLNYNIPETERKPVNNLYIDGYGWWTGHLHKLDSIVINGVSVGAMLNPTFTARTSSSLTASWATVPGANYMAVLASDSGYSNIVSSVTQSGNTKTFTGLSGGTTYYFEVKLATETDAAFALNQISTTTNNPPLTSLTPVFSARSGTTLTASWAAVAGANYVAVLALDSGYSNMVTSVTQSGNIKAFSGLSTGRAYYFEVKLATETDSAFMVNKISTTTVFNGAWLNAASMLSARSAHTATLLPNGKVFVTGGWNISSTELYDQNTNIWSSAGSMLAARYMHTATLLSNGKILVTGSGGGDSSAEIYDPDINIWSSAGAIASWYSHAATLLPNGKVLVTGGFYNGSELSSAELYDPNTNTWSNAASMASARTYHTATLLSNGKVLVTGGSYLNSAELYNPNTNTWSSAASMASPRLYHTATLLPNGKVLVVGGWTAELYDSNTNTWSSAGSLLYERYYHTATLLPNGNVLITGGTDFSSYYDSAEIYNPNTNTWTSAGVMAAARLQHTATLLPNGNTLVTGGSNSDDASPIYSAELFSYPLVLTRLTPAFTQVGVSSITLAWGAIPGANYTIAVSSDANFMSILSSTTQSGNTKAFIGLSGRARYYFEVKLSTEAEWAYVGNRISTTLLSTTSLHPQFSQVYTTSTTVTWDTVAGAYYTVVLASNSLYTNIVSSATGTANAKTFTGLAANTSWYFEVKLSSETDAAYTVNRISSITLAVMPGLPSGAVYTEVYTSSMTVNWSSGTAASGYNPTGIPYKVELSTTAGFNQILISSQTYNLNSGFTGLTPNTTYYARVTAINNAGIATQAFNLGSVSTLALQPTASVSPITAVTATSMMFNWNNGGNPNGTSYALEYSATAVFAPSVKVGTTSLSLAVSGLLVNTTYYARVFAINNAGTATAALNIGSASTLANPPAAVSATPINRAAIRASWNAAGNPTQTVYELKYSSDPGSYWQTVSTNSVAFDLTGLLHATTYYIKVRALNGAGIPTSYIDGNTSATQSNPTISSLSGISLGEKMYLTVKGSSFYSGDQVRLEKSGQGIVNAEGTPVVKQDHSEIYATLNLTALPAGAWNVVVYNADASDSGVSGNNLFFISTVTLGGGITQALMDSAITSTITIPGGIEQIIVPPGVIPNGFILISTNPEINPIIASSATILAATQALPHNELVMDIREYVAYSNTAVLNSFSTPVTFVINYPDNSPDDGIVDGTEIQERNLKLVTLDGTGAKWVEVPAGEYLIDTINNTITARRSHFSVYALLGVSIAGNLTQSKVYPIPWKPSSNGNFGSANVAGCGTGLIFDKITSEGTIRIYNIPGDLVREISFSATDNGCKAWDGKNDAGRNVASGVYIAIIKNKGSGSGSSIKKLAIER